MKNGKPIIGFIGLGVMGKSMASHMLNAGYSLYVYNRTKEKAAELLQKGAIWSETPKDVAQKANVIFTIVGFPEDVEEVYLSEGGLINNVIPGTYLIDMTTSSPTLAEKLYEEGKKRELFVLDAPVSGGDIGAKEARLAIMVGGDESAFNEMHPIFQIIGKNISFFGKAGSGQHTKMANQIAIATNMIGVCEALIYAKEAGLDVQKVHDTISTGAAASFSLSNLGARILKEDYSPGFFIKHFIKDMRIALSEAEKMGVNLPGLSLAKEMYDQLAERGEDNNGTQALYKYWES